MNNPIRLALVITELEVGGAEKCLVELATHIDRQRFTPVVYSLGPRPDSKKDALVRRLEETQIEVHFFDLDKWSDYWGGVRRLAAALRRQRAEIVQTFLFHANVLGTRAARRAGVRRIATGVRVADPRRWRSIVERWTTRSADRFVCVSHGVAEHCRRRGFATRKLVVIPNGIDLAAWDSAEPANLTHFGLPPGQRAIVYVGRLDAQKRVKPLVALMATELAAAIPKHDLLLVGEGPLRSPLEELAGRLRIGSRVHFAGWRPDVPNVLAAADLLVLPSQWEGMPNAVLEAMAAGKPVVATLAEGVQELLGERVAEQGVPLGAGWAPFCDRITAILGNSQTARDLGRHNQERAQRHFSREAMLAAYERLYFELASR
jgi:glycosyltransferase involved in cell wall biosynthesis